MYGDGLSIPQFASPTRFAYSYYVVKQRATHIDRLSDICASSKSSTNINDDRVIIVVIGESFSKYHSSLYDYEFETNPELSKLKERGELYVFNDVVTPYNTTHAVMCKIFSLGEFPNAPLFPSCFKNAGYYTHLSDNQYNIGNARYFLTDQKLSEIMFNSRKDFNQVHDMILIESINIDYAPSLYIFHLKGQHYTYANCYPKEFKHFTTTDYDEQKYNESQREIIAHYDNATLYNDYVISKLIEKCQHKNACLVYFSDHGEEIFETRDYMGHGDEGSNRESIDLQIKIPFMIWMSEKFKNSNSDIASKIANNVNTPLSTNDLAHFLLGLGGIQQEMYDPTRDFLNDKYDKSRHRIVLKSIDYDNYQSNTFL